MEVMDGATPKGLEEAGVGETPLLEMVLPGVTAMPGAGDEPGSERWKLNNTECSVQKGKGTILVTHAKCSEMSLLLNHHVPRSIWHPVLRPCLELLCTKLVWKTPLLVQTL